MNCVAKNVHVGVVHSIDGCCNTIRALSNWRIVVMIRCWQIGENGKVCENLHGRHPGDPLSPDQNDTRSLSHQQSNSNGQAVPDNLYVSMFEGRNWFVVGLRHMLVTNTKYLCQQSNGNDSYKICPRPNWIHLLDLKIIGRHGE